MKAIQTLLNLRRFAGSLMLLALLTAGMATTAHAADVCRIGSTGYALLGDALAAVTNGGTITLLDNITYNSTVTVSGKTITFDTNGFNLNVKSGGVAGLELWNGTVNKTGAGELNVSGQAKGIYANGTCAATVTQASSPGTGVYVETNTTLTVTGNVSGQRGIYYDATSVNVTIYGNVTGSGPNSEGIYASANATPACKVYVSGNVSGEATGVRTFAGPNEITIDGTITSGGNYININGTVKTQADFTTSTTKSGYLTYTDNLGESTVWVKETVGVQTLTDVSTNVRVTGSFSPGAVLTVTVIPSGNPSGDAVRAQAAGKSLLSLYYVSITGSYNGSLNITIPVPAKYNGRTLQVIHDKGGGSLDTQSVTATSGAVAFTLTSLSPIGVVAIDDDYSINDGVNTTGYKWAETATINLAAGNVMTILPAAVSPVANTLIQINGAGATINGNAGSTYDNLYIYMTYSDVFTINNLNLNWSTATNQLIKIANGSNMSVNGTCTLNTDNWQTIYIFGGGNITVPFGASLTVNNTGMSHGITASGSTGNITFNIEGALTVNSSIGGSPYPITINKNGSATMNVNKYIIQCNVLNINAGTLNVTNTVGYAIGMVQSATYTVSVAAGAILNATAGGFNPSYGIEAGTNSLAITNNGTMNINGGTNGAAINCTGTLDISMGAGATTTLTNHSATAEIHPFTMATGVPAGSTWALSGSATKTNAADALTLSPLSVTIPTNTTGTITLGAGGGSFVCSIGSTQYMTLDDALAAVLNGETITLLADITESSAVTMAQGFAFTIDKAGYDLTFGSDVVVNSGTDVTIMGAGALTTGNIVVENYGSKLTVDGDLTCWWLFAWNNGAIDVSGNVTSTYTTVTGPFSTLYNGATINIGGSVTTAGSGAFGAYDAGTTLSVGGNITCGGMAINAHHRAQVTVTGDVSSTAGTGVYADGGAQVIISGTLAGTPYIQIGNVTKTAADKDATSAKANYFQYTDAGSTGTTVWVKASGTPPTITTASLTNGTVGTAYSQTLAATGTTPISWSVSVGSLPAGLSLNATSGVISGTPTAAGTSNFTVKAANGISPDATKALSITINPSAPVIVDAATPIINVQPQGATVNEGDALTLSVTATVSDGGTLSYQWYYGNGMPISGATAAGYSPPTTPAGTYYYYVAVTNTNTGVNGMKTATVTSNVATVTVTSFVNAATPTISIQPQSVTVNEGEVATLSVQASVSDGGTLSYQWYDGSTGLAISGATGDSYSPPTSTAGTYYYYVAITNTNTGVNGSKTITKESVVAKVIVKKTTAIENVSKPNLLKAWIEAGTLHLSGLTAGKPWSVYNVAGILIYQGIASNNEAMYRLAFRGVYIVQSVNRTVKVEN